MKEEDYLSFHEPSSSSSLHSVVSEAKNITKKSKSNLALAFTALPKERREDMEVLYAYCRVVDDIADEPGPTREERQKGLDQWRRVLKTPEEGEPTLAAAVRKLMVKHDMSPDLLAEIIDGVEMDLNEVSFATWDDLRLYCHRVASVVGLACMHVFGANVERSREYALNLGLALQLTNIIRDVGQDYANEGRIYLPAEDMKRFGFTEQDLKEKRYSPSFQSLMEFESARAETYYKATADAFPKSDARALVASEIMRGVYGRLLERMKADKFQVLDKRYRLGKFSKLWQVGKGMLRGFISPRRGSD